jgi:aldo/keto reductase family protein
MLTGTNLLAESSDPASAALLQRTLGRTGLTLSIVSMGVMNADVPGILRRSYELGIRHSDTAAVYQNGRNEEVVGSLIKEMRIRDKVVISTKERKPAPVPKARRTPRSKQMHDRRDDTRSRAHSLLRFAPFRTVCKHLPEPYPRFTIVGLSGSNSVVECDLAKVEVAGSNPVSRSRFLLFPTGSCSKMHRLGFETLFA